MITCGPARGPGGFHENRPTRDSAFLDRASSPRIRRRRARRVLVRPGSEEAGAEELRPGKASGRGARALPRRGRNRPPPLPGGKGRHRLGEAPRGPAE